MELSSVKEYVADLREQFARLAIDTSHLKEFGAKLNDKVAYGDIGNAIRKLLEFCSHQLFNLAKPNASPPQTLAVTLNSLADIDSVTQSPAWKQYNNYARFLKSTANLCVHSTDSSLCPISELDVSAMSNAICKLCVLFLSLYNILRLDTKQTSFERHPGPFPPRVTSSNTTPNEHSRPQKTSHSVSPGRKNRSIDLARTLWIGNIPADMTLQQLCSLVSNSRSCVIKDNKKKSHGATPFKYAFIDFPTPEDAFAAKQTLSSVEPRFEIRFKQYPNK